MSVEKQGTNNRKFLFIALIVILVLINGIQFYISQREKAKSKAIKESMEMDLFNTYAKLDSISNQLENKIEVIRELGGNIDSLLEVQAQLEEDKIALQNYQRTTEDRYNKIKDKVEGYEVLLKRKDQEIARLEEVNRSLHDENIGLKEDKNDLNQKINKLEDDNDDLASKVNEAAVLKVSSIILKGCGKNGKAKEGNSFRVKQLEKLQVAFLIEENPLADVGTKEIYLVILEPEGSTLYNIASGSGTFNYQNKDIPYTESKEVLFDNTGQEFFLEYDKGSEFKKGPYTLELYCEGAKIGKSDFIVR